MYFTNFKKGDKGRFAGMADHGEKGKVEEQGEMTGPELFDQVVSNLDSAQLQGGDGCLVIVNRPVENEKRASLGIMGHNISVTGVFESGLGAVDTAFRNASLPMKAKFIAELAEWQKAATSGLIEDYAKDPKASAELFAMTLERMETFLNQAADIVDRKIADSDRQQ